MYQADSNRFTVILEGEINGGYSVYCPALPGCVSQGDDRQSALENIKEAIGSILDLSEELPSLPEAPALIADEIREVLDGRMQDGLSYSGISLEQVEISVKALT